MHFLTKIQLCKQDVCELVGGAEFVDSRINTLVIDSSNPNWVQQAPGAMRFTYQSGFNYNLEW